MRPEPSPDDEASSDPIFLGDSEMARQMRAHDWASTPLGPPSRWPNALRVALRILLTSRFEMWIGWGPDIRFFYNDAYRPTLGDKHGRALGTPIRELYGEIWDDIEGRFRAVYERGEATWDRGLLLILQRHGYDEETYHTFSYSPLLGDGGAVEGLFCAVTEETDRILNDRRLGTLRELGAALAGTDGLKAVIDAACASLARNAHDLPFTLTYLFDDTGGARLACATGIERGHACAPAEVPAMGSLAGTARTLPWDWHGLGADSPPREVDLRGVPDLPHGAWDRPPEQALVVPLGTPQSDGLHGVLVVGLNPMRRLDGGIRGFVSLLAGQLSAALAGAQAVEAERRRASMLAEAVQLRQAAADALRRANESLSTEVRERTRERDHLRGLFEQAPSFMCLLGGADHVFELVNESYRQLVGHRDLIGRKMRDALPEIEGQGYFELLDTVFRTGEAFVGHNLSVQVQRTPGAPPEQRFLDLVYQPVFGAEGAVTGIFVDGSDVTRQKLAEDGLQALNATLEDRVARRTEELAEALAQLNQASRQREEAEAALRHAQRLESLGALTGGVAHDFNNLLQVISGNLQLLRRHVAGDGQAEKRVANALGGVARGAKLASQLLAFGRRQPLEPKVVNIGRLVRNMDDMLRRTLGEEIELETVIAGGLWNNLVDPTQIENALLNLVINARDAMPDGGRLTIEASNASLDDAYAQQHAELKPGQYVMIAVTDTGHGIPPELLDRVIEPFFSTKPEGKGTGLGLSMVYGFVKQSGGHIKIYSEVGEGTTLRLYLPRNLQSEDVLIDPTGAPVAGGSETVLVVEDDEAVRDTAVAIVADLGYQVLKARDAASALHVIESGVPVDLLFTDVVMPGPLRSPELARKARERLPDIAVLFTSGYTENAIVHGGRLDPGVELLSKPYSREQLARKIRHVLSLREARPATPAGAAAGAGPGAGTDTAASTPVVAESAAGPLNVLLVEDDAQVREGTAALLAGAGHTVATAADAPQALRLLAVRGFDVLVTDVALPGPSGIDLARQARARWPAMAVVFATGHHDATLNLTFPGAAVLVKPYDTHALERALAETRRRQGS